MTSTNSIRTLSYSGNLIAGVSKPGTGQELKSICPADQSVVWTGFESKPADVDAAISAARIALSSWSGLKPEQRIAFVEKYAELIRQNSDELAELISAETGKPVWESKTEVGAVVGKAAVSIDAFRQRRDTFSFEMGELNAVTRFKPYGVMGVLGPFNFPAHLPNGHIVPALIAGNTVVYKPSEQTPAVGQWMTQKWQEVGLPDGVVNLVQGSRDTGVSLSAHQQLDGLLFTGSSNAGRALHRIFGEHPEKLLALEMGGNNPLIVHEANDLEAAAYLTIQSAFITAGQRCTCARRLIVPESQSDAFIQTLVEMMAKVRIAPFTANPEPFAGTLISQAQGRKLLSQQQELVGQGAKSFVEMKSLEDNDALLSPGLIDVTELSERSDEEMFGPILTLIRVPDFDAAIEQANNTAYGLSAGLISSNRDAYDRFISKIRAGIVNWNRQTTGATGKMPFGGCGLSGNHRPSAWFAADYCSFPVASLEASELAMPEKLSPGIEL